MSRTLGTLVAFFVSVLLAANAVAAAESDGPRAPRPIWGTVTKATADSVTVAPEVAAARRRREGAEHKPDAEKPAERTFALSKDQTELAFAEVGMKRLMADGTTLRTLTEPEPATTADLKAGQLVEVTPGEGGTANRIIIAWSAAGTIVKVEGDSITFRPAAAAADADDADGAGAAKQDDDAGAAADAAEEQELAISKAATRVTVATVADERPAPGGPGFVQTIKYKAGTLADLKADQSVVICIKGDTAAKITIHAANAKP